MNAEDLKPLLAARMRQAQECLEDARCLLSSGRGARTIVNRAYYAAFYSTLALLQTIGKVPRKHVGALRLLNLEFVKAGLLPKELSETLHFLFERRQDDDYRRVDPIELAEARQSLEMADRFVHAVRSYLESTGQLPVHSVR